MTVQLCQWINSKNVKIGLLADRWQQSFQQQFITVVAAINLRAKVHKHQTPSNSPLRQQWFVDYARVGWQQRQIVVVAGTYTQSFWMLTGGATMKFFLSAQKMKFTASDRNWRNNFCHMNQARCSLPPWVPGSALLQISYHGNTSRFLAAWSNSK